MFTWGAGTDRRTAAPLGRKVWQNETIYKSVFPFLPCAAAERSSAEYPIWELGRGIKWESESIYGQRALLTPVSCNLYTSSCAKSQEVKT